LECGPRSARMRAMRSKLTAAVVAVSALLAACASDFGQRESEPRPAPPVVDKNAASVAVLTEDLQLLQRLAQAAPAEQPEILAAAQRDYDTAPTPSRQLRLALVLANPGHPATDLPRAQRLLRELQANPEMLLSVERALAFLELQQIDDHLTLEAENRR